MPLLHRVSKAFMPWYYCLLWQLIYSRKPFFEEGEKPDLYGPFWIATTLVFLVTVAGNLATYLRQLSNTDPLNSTWYLDIAKMTSAASMYYSLISIVPLSFAFLAQQMGSSVTILFSVNILGYGMAIYLPVAFLCMIPSDAIMWLLLCIAFIVSAWFSHTNFKPFFNLENKNQALTLAGLLLFHMGMAIACKFYFFAY